PQLAWPGDCHLLTCCRGLPPELAASRLNALPSTGSAGTSQCAGAAGRRIVRLPPPAASATLYPPSPELKDCPKRYRARDPDHNVSRWTCYPPPARPGDWNMAGATGGFVWRCCLDLGVLCSLARPGAHHLRFVLCQHGTPDRPGRKN